MREFDGEYQVFDPYSPIDFYFENWEERRVSIEAMILRMDGEKP